VQRHEVEFLAHETAQVIVVAKVLRDGKADQTSASILIDGKPCTGSECGFRAEKGRTYGLRAEARPKALTTSASRSAGPDLHMNCGAWSYASRAVTPRGLDSDPVISCLIWWLSSNQRHPFGIGLSLGIGWSGTAELHSMLDRW
jgi:hypothetical protein